MNRMTTRPVDVSYLVMGLVFLGIAGTWALHEAGIVAAADVEWLIPLSLVVAGVLGLVAFATRGRRGRRETTTGPGSDDPYAATYSGYDPQTYDSQTYDPYQTDDDTSGGTR